MFKTFRNKSLWAERTANLLAGYIRFTRSTSRFVYDPPDMDDYFRRHDPFILGVWHGQFLLIPTIRPDDISGTIVVGGHGDAELAAGVVSRFGVTPIRGSGAGGRRVGRDRGGAKVLREALKALKAGDCIVSTVDVPPGPAQRAGPGIITMARLSGRPIIPAAIATNRALTFQSWSRLTINLPFSKGALVAGAPMFVPRTATNSDLEKLRRLLEMEMDQVTKRAYQLVGKSPSKILPLWQRTKKPGLGLKTYQLVTDLARPIAPLIFNYRLRRGKEEASRKGERFGKPGLPRPQGPLWWFHAASVGEANAILPLIEKSLANEPTLSILLTTGTVTSANLAASRLPERAMHQFIPMDNRSFVRSFLNHWQPDLAIFTESEIWPNLIFEIKAKDIQLVLLNGRMSKRSFKRWFKKPSLARPLFGRFDEVYTQSPVDTNHFIALGAERVIETGNLKADAPPLKIEQDELNRMRTAFAGRRVLLAASTHKGEEEEVIKCHDLLTLDYPDLLTVIIPRHPDRGEDLQEKFTSREHRISLRSQTPTPGPETNIFIANTIGELGLFYELSDITFIGGSLVPHGGQNPIEAINHGANIFTGPHVRNFASFYYELFIRGGAIQVHSGEDLAAKVNECFQNPDQYEKMLNGAKEAMKFLKGAEEKTLSLLMRYLKPGDHTEDKT